MRDEIDSRLWVEHHEQFSRSVKRGLKRLLNAFCTLTTIQFDAPWRERRSAC